MDNFKESLSIVELEERHEMSALISETSITPSPCEPYCPGCRCGGLE